MRVIVAKTGRQTCREAVLSRARRGPLTAVRTPHRRQDRPAPYHYDFLYGNGHPVSIEEVMPVRPESMSVGGRPTPAAHAARPPPTPSTPTIIKKPVAPADPGIPTERAVIARLGKIRVRFRIRGKRKGRDAVTLVDGLC